MMLITSRPKPLEEEPVFHLRSYGDVTAAQLEALTKPANPVSESVKLELGPSPTERLRLTADGRLYAVHEGKSTECVFSDPPTWTVGCHVLQAPVRISDTVPLEQLTDALARVEELRTRFDAVCAENLQLWTAYNEAQTENLEFRRRLHTAY